MEKDLSGFFNSLPRARDIIITDIGATWHIRITEKGQVFVRGADKTREAQEVLLDPRMIHEALSLLSSKIL